MLLSNGERAGAAGTGGEIGRGGGRTRTVRGRGARAGTGGAGGAAAARAGGVTDGRACARGPAQGVNVACRSALRLSQLFVLT